MSGPNWRDCAIFISWDDWGGFYDHVVPVKVDEYGYGLRVPGYIIEDDFLGGQRLDPKTDGRPGPRPTVREDVAELGDLRREPG